MKLKRRTYKVEVPSVAMGDIAFNLLIFFFILANPEEDRGIKWDPAPGTKLEKIGPSTIRLVVSAKGDDNRHRVYLNGKEVSVSTVKDQVEVLLNARQSGSSPEEKERSRWVVVKIDRDVPAQVFEPVIEAVSQAQGVLVHMLRDDGSGR